MTFDVPTRLVLVDDHTMLRQAMQQMLDVEPDLIVVGQAGDGESAVRLVKRTHPDVVLLDVEMPGNDVRTTMQQLRESAPDTRVLIVSMYDEPELLHELLGLGISGYLLKSASRQELVAAIRAVSSDRSRVVISVSNFGVRPPASTVLSTREIDVLTLTAQALSNTQIASRLSISEGTVKRHLRNIFGKLGAVSRIDAVNKAVAASHIPAKSARSTGSRRSEQGGSTPPRDD